ncbi:MAG TPA: DUF58 domain-containing protein, partial [Arenibacter sp.]|nr:DUF58 domain-containing protein [Arenibacter sp.]
MKSIFKNSYLEQRFFIVLTLLILGFLCSYMFPDILGAIRLLFYIFILIFIGDFLLLFGSKGHITGNRIIPDKLSNGDENEIGISLSNSYLFYVDLKILDEIPHQFQKRDFRIYTTIGPGKEKHFKYGLRPTERGVYFFGNLNIFARSPIGLISKRYTFNREQKVPVYPSFLQLHKYNLIAFSNHLFEYGLKKVRRIGHTMEFEQIKDYVQGDDIRNINWKATAKRGELMVNQFQDERSQPIYSIIDKGRVMKMPFGGLSLLDYAINATLVISNIAIKKQDKAGMFTFSNTIENRVAAERRSAQLNLILETLYHVRTNFVESDFSLLYADIKRNIDHRSLLLLYTNFETLDALERQLPYLLALAKQHLLVVIFFENTELIEFAEE